MARNPRWDTEKLSSHAPRAGAREPGAAAATCGMEGARAPAAADGYGPDLLGRAVQVLEELEEFPAHGAARDRSRLASARVQALLGMEESTPRGSSRDRNGTPRANSADEPRQPAVGRAADPRRAAEARPDGLAGDGLEVHASAAAAAVTGVAGVSEESRQGANRVGFLHGAHGNLSGLVCARGAEP